MTSSAVALVAVAVAVALVAVALVTVSSSVEGCSPGGAGHRATRPARAAPARTLVAMIAVTDWASTQPDCQVGWSSLVRM